MNAVEEYLPNSQSNGNGNHNGNGKLNGVFNLVRKEDPTWTKVAPKARREVIFDTRIPEGARMFYCFLIDCSLWEGVNKRPGVVKFPNSYLVQKLGVSEKTIQNWKRALESTGRLWITQQKNKNAFPTTVYNITAIVGQQQLPMNFESEDGSLPEFEEHLTNRHRRNLLIRDGNGKWRGGSKSVECSKLTNFAETAESKEAARNNLPSGAATNCVPERQPIACQSGNQLPSRAATNCVRERQSIAAVDGNQLRAGAANGCRRGRQMVAVNKEVRGKRSEPSRAGEATPRRGDWEKKLKKLFPRELEKLKADLVKQQKALEPGNPVIADLSCRIEAIDEALYGGKVPAPKPSRKPAPVKVQSEQPTPEAIEEGKAYLLSIGKKDLVERLYGKAQ